MIYLYGISIYMISLFGKTISVFIKHGSVTFKAIIGLCKYYKKKYINKEPTLSTLNIFVYFRHHQKIY